LFIAIGTRDWVKTALAVCPKIEAAEFQLDCMEEEVDNLEKLLSREDETIGFCHNDLQYGNIMLHEEDKSLTIIVSILHLNMPTRL
jgi:choline/ethanolamine kinase